MYSIGTFICTYVRNCILCFHYSSTTSHTHVHSYIVVYIYECIYQNSAMYIQYVCKVDSLHIRTYIILFWFIPVISWNEAMHIWILVPGSTFLQVYYILFFSFLQQYFLVWDVALENMPEPYCKSTMNVVILVHVHTYVCA